MTKTITSMICLLFIATVGRSQEFNPINTSPGENTKIQEYDWQPLELQDEINWRENSVGLFFMPKPLGINALEIYDENGNSNVKEKHDIEILVFPNQVIAAGSGASGLNLSRT